MDPDTQDALLKAIARALGWMETLISCEVTSSDEIAAAENLAERHVRFLLPLAFLSPKIIKAIANDSAPAGLNVSHLARALPHTWSDQERILKEAAHIREIANSISTLGFNVPLLINREGVVIDGDARLAAASMLGLSSVPCIKVDHLNETEQRLLRLAVNRLGEKGTWDVEELQAEFQELIIEEAPIDLSGFGSDEIDQILIDDDDPETEIGDLTPPPGAQPVARLGDVFRLGPHRLICADATDPAVIARLMGNDIARMVFTDEPFNVAISGHVTGGDHREFVMASGEMSDAQFLDFNRNWMAALLPYLVDGGILGTFIDWRGLPIVHTAATAPGLSPLNLVVWAKTNAGMGIR